MKDLLRGLVVLGLSLGLALGLAAALAGSVGALGGVPLSYGVVAVAFGIDLAAWVPASLWKTERFYDLTGSLTYLAALALLLVGSGGHPRALLAGAMVAVWALRLGSFLFVRVRRAGEDRRFAELKSTPGRFLVPWSLQGLWVTLTLTAVTVLLGDAAPPPLGPLDALGAALWATGFGVEVVADRQKSAFKANPANAGRFIDVGLWSWSRHPNYFGEILLWTGIFVGGAGVYHGAGWLAAASPVFVFVLLRFGSGVPILERQARARWGQDPAWQDYMRRTSRLIPWPPGPRSG